MIEDWMMIQLSFIHFFFQITTELILQSLFGKIIAVIYIFSLRRILCISFGLNSCYAIEVHLKFDKNSCEMHVEH